MASKKLENRTKTNEYKQSIVQNKVNQNIHFNSHKSPHFITQTSVCYQNQNQTEDLYHQSSRINSRNLTSIVSVFLGLLFTNKIISMFALATQLFSTSTFRRMNSNSYTFNDTIEIK